MTGPQVFKNVLQKILESIPKLVDVRANDGELIEEELCDQLPGFSPTREELIHLVKHWLKMIIDDHWIWFFDKEELHREHTLYVAKYRIERILEHGLFFKERKRRWNLMDDECPNFVCVRSELKELAKHWAEEAFRYDFFIFAGGCFGSSDLRRIDFMWSRVDRIGEVLGRNEVHEIVNYVKSTLCAESKGWDIAFNGSEAQREALQQEIQDSRDGVHNEKEE